jgi:AcrR family transcriptional regulator
VNEGVQSREPLTRERVLRTALELIDEEGLDALTMRRLGRRLGVEAMSLYRYVPRKDALVAGVVELLLSELEVPGSDAGDWADRLRGAMASYARIAEAHPHAFPLLVGRPTFTPAALRPAERLFALLREAGFDAEATLFAIVTLWSYADGFLLTRGAMLTDEREWSEASRAALPADLGGLDHVADVTPLKSEAHGPAGFHAGIDLILEGLRRLLDDDSDRGPSR